VLVAIDSTRPRIPPQPNLPLDSTYTVAAPDLPRAEGLYYRNILGIIVDDTASGPTIRDLFRRYHGTIIGGNPADGEYIIRIPDPGPSFAAVEAIVSRIYTEPGVSLARKVYYRTPIYLQGTNETRQVSGRVVEFDSRYPLPYAVVTMRGTSFVTQTDSIGRFLIPGPVPPGCYRLTVRAIGYAWTEVRFAANQTLPTILGDVPLRAAPFPEWPLTLLNGCDAGPLSKDDAPWGVDTLPSR